jgi:hypothetical protein
MADKHRAFILECCIAEEMVGMNVRVDDVSDRFRRAGPDRGEQPEPFTHAAAGIDDRNRLTADDKSEIGNGTEWATSRGCEWAASRYFEWATIIGCEWARRCIAAEAGSNAAAKTTTVLSAACSFSLINMSFSSAKSYVASYLGFALANRPETTAGECFFVATRQRRA